MNDPNGTYFSMEQAAFVGNDYVSQIASCALTDTVTTNGEAQRKRKAEPLPDVEYSKQEEYKRMMAPLSREQLMDILARGCAVHADVRATTQNLVEASPASRRLMVRNISFVTTESSLREIFSLSGDIEDFTICRDRTTGKSKGFGFVTFTTIDAVDQVMKSKVEVDGRTLLIKLAADPIGELSVGGAQADPVKCKLFVRNLPDGMTDAKLQSEFGEYGYINEAVVVRDNSGKSKGYGFVTYNAAEDACKALQHPQRVIQGRMTFVTKASPSSGRNYPKGGAPVASGGMPGGAAVYVGSGGYNSGMASGRPVTQHVGSVAMQSQIPMQQQYQYSAAYAPTIIQTPGSMYPQQPSLYTGQQQAAVGMAAYAQVSPQGGTMMTGKVAHGMY